MSLDPRQREVPLADPVQLVLGALEGSLPTQERPERKDQFESDKTGYRETTSAATGTGARAMLVCVDDPTSVDQAAPMPSAPGEQLVDRDDNDARETAQRPKRWREFMA